MRAIWVVFLSAFFINLAFGVDISAFPKAKEGQTLQLLTLKPMENEQNYKVEIEFGKNVEVDCNHYFFVGGKLEQKNLEGYGYVYYEFGGKPDMAGTLMACPNNKKTSKFIKFEPKITAQYKSNSPFIIYTPKDTQIRYKVYQLVDEQFLDKSDDEKRGLSSKSSSSNSTFFAGEDIQNEEPKIKQNEKPLIKTH